MGGGRTKSILNGLSNYKIRYAHFLVTSLNSDEDGGEEDDPLNVDETRKLERNIKKLFKDIHKLADDSTL